MSDLVTLLLAEAQRFIRPLTDISVSPEPMRELRRLLGGCGWFVTADIDPSSLVNTVAAVIIELEVFTADPVPDDLSEVLARIERLTVLVDRIRSLGLSLGELGDVGPVDAAGGAALAEDLAHHLTLLWLQRAGETSALLAMLGIVERVAVPEVVLGWLSRPARAQVRVRPSVLPRLLADPAAFVLERLVPEGWPTADHAAATMMGLFRALNPLIPGRGCQSDPRRGRLGFNAAASPLRSTVTLTLPTRARARRTDLGLDVQVFGADAVLPSGQQGPGAVLTPFGAAASSLRWGAWDIALSAAFELGRPIEIGSGGAAIGPGVEAWLDVEATRSLQVVLGVARTGITLGDLVVTAGVSAESGSPPELRVGLVARNSRVGISTRDFGPAIAKVLPLDLELPFDLGLEWSSQTGLALSGTASLSLSLGTDIVLPGGVFRFGNLMLELELGTEVVFVFSGDVHFSLNVLQAVVEGLGIRLELSFPDSGGNLGAAHLRVALDPPELIGFAIDIEAVKGGGFLAIDHEIGRYSGALALQIMAVGIRALTVIDTQLPSGAEGFALFASLTATFPGIPLGFGFTLTGVGGLLALNRALDAEALAAGLRSGVLDALLFPEDPVGDSAELIAQIDDYFPLLDGNTMVGPIIEIGWGSPTLITAQLGVVISLPEGLIAVMGSVEVLLPTPEAALITLHMDSLGVIDLGAGTFSLTASLYDSRLLEAIDLGGDMAMYLQLGEQPYFLLSVGGYSPGFEPPAIVPAAMHDLRRMQASIAIGSSVSIVIEAYLAVTSNSVQFGSAVNVVASVEIWPTRYTARGWFCFDVLLVFSPFKIVAAMSAGVGIYAGNKELLGVQLDLLLEGPKPWYASGNASFKFFGLKVSFELEVGSRALGEPKPIVHPRAAVLAALRSPASWSETPPLGVVAGITYVAVTAEGEVVWVRPDHSLTVRQSVAPLNRTLQIVGQALPAPGEECMTVISAGFDTGPAVAWDLAEDWFAPAQFEVLDRTDKLTRASFERMTAGVTFGAPVAAIPEGDGVNTSVAMDYEEETWQPDPDADPLAHSVNSGAVHFGLRYVSARASTPMFVLSPTAYTLVRSGDGVEASGVLRDEGLSVGGVSQYQAQSARRAAVSKDAGEARRLVAVAASAALDATP